MWNADNNHQKHNKIALVSNVDISEDDENVLENKWIRVQMAGKQLYIFPTIKERKNTYFCHMIRRDNIHRLISDGPLEGKYLEEGKERMTNIKEWTGLRYEDLVRLVRYRGQWRIMTANKTKLDYTVTTTRSHCAKLCCMLLPTLDGRSGYVYEMFNIRT